MYARIYLVPSGLVEKAMARHPHTLVWKIPWTEEPGGLQSMGSLRFGQDWATSLSLFTFIHWRRKWQPTRVLAWIIPGTGEPGGLPSMGLHRVRHDWSDVAAAAALVWGLGIYLCFLFSFSNWFIFLFFFLLSQFSLFCRYLENYPFTWEF